MRGKVAYRVMVEILYQCILVVGVVAIPRSAVRGSAFRLVAEAALPAQRQTLVALAAAPTEERQEPRVMVDMQATALAGKARVPDSLKMIHPSRAKTAV